MGDRTDDPIGYTMGDPRTVFSALQAGFIESSYGVLSVASTSQTTREALIKSRIQLTTAFDIMLFKLVVAVDGHPSVHGATQALFSDALKHFMKSVPPSVFETVQAPSWESLNDRFKKLLVDHRDVTKKNSAPSGIVEKRV